MLQLEHAEVTWQLNAYCKLQCSYCQPEWKTGSLDTPVAQYLTVIEKLQNTRYQHHKKIYWKIGGGEPLHFPQLSTLLRKMREQPSIIRLDTSGDDTYFSLYGVLNLIDRIKLTYHYWQNDDVVGFLLEQCLEREVDVSIKIPLAPRKITESREKVEYFKNLGYVCDEQILYDRDGKLHRGYSNVDANRIHGRPDDWQEEVTVYDPNLPDPNYIDISIINEIDPIYTGQPCYAGVDWMHINPKGFVSYSQCGGRNEHFNVFETNWQPPNAPFPCTVNQCRHEQDRKKIRIISS